ADRKKPSASAGSYAGSRTGSRAGLLKSSSSIKPPLLRERRRAGLLDEVSDRSAKQRPADSGVVIVQAAADRNESFSSARSPEQLLAHGVGNDFVGCSMDVEHGKSQLAHLLDGIEALTQERSEEHI